MIIKMAEKELVSIVLNAMEIEGKINTRFDKHNNLIIKCSVVVEKKQETEKKEDIFEDWREVQ